MNRNCEKLKRIIYELERQLEETGGMYESVSFELEKKSFKFQEIMKYNQGELQLLHDKNEKHIQNVKNLKK